MREWAMGALVENSYVILSVADEKRVPEWESPTRLENGFYFSNIEQVNSSGGSLEDRWREVAAWL